MKKGYLTIYMLIVLFMLGITGLLLRSVWISKQAMVEDFIQQDKQLIIEYTESFPKNL